MTRPLLLVLGSNLADDTRLHAAVTALNERAPARLLAPVLSSPDATGGGRYFNALVEWSNADPAASWLPELKRLEARLGRVRDGSGVVAIDIDWLGEREGMLCLPSARAIAKGELKQAFVRELLRQAGLRPDSADS